MPQFDLYHEPVKQALIKDGWTITDDPFTIEYKGLRLYADLGAEKPIAQDIVAVHEIHLLVFDPDTKEVVQWIS